MENWKDVTGYEGLYQVSDQGNVRSLNWRGSKGTKNLWLKPHNKGYLQVELAKNGVRKTFTVHRLVANAFVPNPDKLPVINHIDEDKQNNRAENLEWCTHKRNMEAFYENHPLANAHTRVPRFGKHKCRLMRRIVQKTIDGEEVKVWDNSRQIFLETGMSDWSISECCRGNRKTAYGFKWQYAN